MAVEQWQKEAAREIRTLKPNYTDARDYAEVIARHYAARDREVQELVKAALNGLDIVAGLRGTLIKPRGELGSAKAINAAVNALRAALGPFTEKQP